MGVSRAAWHRSGPWRVILPNPQSAAPAAAARALACCPRSTHSLTRFPSPPTPQTVTCTGYEFNRSLRTVAPGAPIMTASMAASRSWAPPSLPGSARGARSAGGTRSRASRRRGSGWNGSDRGRRRECSHRARHPWRPRALQAGTRLTLQSADNLLQAAREQAIGSRLTSWRNTGPSRRSCSPTTSCTGSGYRY